MTPIAALCMVLMAAGLISSAGAQPYPNLPSDETVVVRGIMPDAYPGAFAVVFRGGPTLCFDPVRGGITFIQSGADTDFRPNWTGKVPQPTKFGGDRFYLETAEMPLRIGDPEAEAVFAFKGYSVDGPYPVFRYAIGDIAVEEELRPLVNGTGVVRAFRTSAPGRTFWLLTGAQENAVCAAIGGEWRDGRLEVTADETGEFVIIIERKTE